MTGFWSWRWDMLMWSCWLPTNVTNILFDVIELMDYINEPIIYQSPIFDHVCICCLSLGDKYWKEDWVLLFINWKKKKLKIYTTKIWCFITILILAFPADQTVKNPPAMWGTWVRSLGWEDPLEEGMTTCSSVLAWRISVDSAGAWLTGYRPWVAKSWTWLNNEA